MGRREFLAHGYQRTSVDAIGKAAGVSKQTIYRHFNDKSDILRAIGLQISDAFEHAVTPVSERMGTQAVIENCIAAIRRSFFANDSIPLFRLGMAIVAAIVAAHRGQVGVSATPGGGATFAVRLPAAPESTESGEPTEPTFTGGSQAVPSVRPS